jgi:hypothetical protein
MIRLATKTRRAPHEVLEAAAIFFGPGGLGFEVSERTETGASFVGGGGHVTVEARAAEGRTEVTVDAREWEHDARRFLTEL